MRTLKLMAGLALLPGLLAAQQDWNQRLSVLPADVRDKVIQIVTEATSHGLPGQAIADRAVETVAKSRSGTDAVAAAQALAADLAGARDALVAAGHTPDASEIEAGATAKELGVDGATIRREESGLPADTLVGYRFVWPLGHRLSALVRSFGVRVQRSLNTHFLHLWMPSAGRRGWSS